MYEELHKEWINAYLDRYFMMADMGEDYLYDVYAVFTNGNQSVTIMPDGGIVFDGLMVAIEDNNGEGIVAYNGLRNSDDGPDWEMVSRMVCDDDPDGRRYQLTNILPLDLPVWTMTAEELREIWNANQDADWGVNPWDGLYTAFRIRECGA